MIKFRLIYDISPRIYSLTDKEHENGELNWAAYWVQADTGLELLATGGPRCQVLDKGCISQPQSMGHSLQAQRDVPSGNSRIRIRVCTRDLPNG